MPVINRVAELADEITAWRRHLHENPEILYEVHETAAFVADKLRSFGVDAIRRAEPTERKAKEIAMR